MNSLLVEIQTEELPPKALKKLSDAFAQEVFTQLKKADFLLPDSKVKAFGAPRRIAVYITDVLADSPDKPFSQRLVPSKIGIGADGKPTAALTKKLAALGVQADVSELKVVNDGKQDQLYYEGVKKGESLEKGLQNALDYAVTHLPIPKVMSYQLANGETVEFVRPVKHLLALYGDKVLNVSLFGLKAGNQTAGHRFHTKDLLTINSADTYETQLEEQGKVIPSFEKRQDKMVAALKREAANLDAQIIMPDDLVNEVASLTEWPVVYVSSFDEDFLKVPEECLILTMQQNQKYFALRDQNGKLINKFLVVSQINAKDGGAAIQSGNARVVRARLADAKFFFEQDQLERLDSRVPGLEHVVYHNKLGNQLQRSERIQNIAEKVAQKLGANAELAKRGAKLAKADLRTLMVGEFPELQGIMGEYYALHDKEDPIVAVSIKEHYYPRYAGGELPSTPESLSVALADKLDTLAGLFGIGQIPTGDKDPFALRRHALGVLRMLIEKDLPLSLDDLIAIAVTEEQKIDGVKDASRELKDFFYDRLRVMLKEEGAQALEVEAVLSVEPKYLREISARLKALQAFRKLEEAASLSAANKRIENILKKSKDSIPESVDEDLLEVQEEKDLYKALVEVNKDLEGKFEKGEYEAILLDLAPLKSPVDAFFDKVMVNVYDEGVRRNRLALLKELHRSMNQVAKLSCLAS